MKPATEEARRLIHEGSIALAQIEHNGMKVDMDYLDRTIASTTEEVKRTEEELKKDEIWKRWKRRFGEKASLTSDDQLRKVVYDKKEDGGLGYEIKEWTKTKKGKVNEAAIEELSEPFFETYILLRKLNKVLSTYLLGVKKEVVDGFVHPMYNFNPETYRSGCSDPNGQNFPIRNKRMAALVRPMFIPRSPDRRFGEIDLSGAEVRSMYVYHQDPTMYDYLVKGGDMHRDTMCKMFRLREDQVDKKGLRDVGKNMFIFPEFYGSYYAKCAQAIWKAIGRRKLRVRKPDDVPGEPTGIRVTKLLKRQGIETYEAFENRVRQTEDWFWNDCFPKYAAWRKEWFRKYLERGWFRSLSGFVWHGVYDRNQTFNFPGQSVAFHWLLWAVIELQKWLRRYKFKTVLTGQIHDSVQPDFVEKEVQDVLEKYHTLVTKDLPKAYPWICIPLSSEAELAEPGKSWHDKKEWIRSDNGVWTPAA
jgi:DNA polymerase I-like protein with 3'-5' exonuclease and polymerase domains